MRAIFLAIGLLGTATAQAANCTIDLKADDAMKFDKTEVTVSSSCKTVTINLAHTGKLPVASMGHNVVVAASADVQPIATAGMSAGAAADYLPAGDKRVIAHTKVLGGGESDTIKIPASALKKGGDYSYECTFPGHVALMKGKFIFG